MTKSVLSVATMVALASSASAAFTWIEFDEGWVTLNGPWSPNEFNGLFQPDVVPLSGDTNNATMFYNSLSTGDLSATSTGYKFVLDGTLGSAHTAGQMIFRVSSGSGNQDDYFFQSSDFASGSIDLIIGTAVEQGTGADYQNIVSVTIFGLNNGNSDVLLDRVRVELVPSPGSLAIAGLAGGFCYRRRRS